MPLGYEKVGYDERQQVVNTDMVLKVDLFSGGLYNTKGLELLV
jgi:hypothetical protein